MKAYKMIILALLTSLSSITFALDDSSTCTVTVSNSSELKTALNNVNSNRVICLNPGTYKPGNSRDDTFLISHNGITLKGLGTTRNDVVLSGDIGIANDATDNSQQVVSVKTGLPYTPLTGIVLKNLTVAYGYNDKATPGLDFNDPSSPNFGNRRGAGIIVIHSQVTLDNVVVRDNIGATPPRSGGAGLAGLNAQINVVNSEFRDNVHVNSGAAMNLQRFTSSSVPVVPDTTLNVKQSKFTHNTASGFGGAIFSNNIKSADINDSQFVANQSVIVGGAIAHTSFAGLPSTLKIKNSYFNENKVIGPSPDDPAGGGAVSAEGLSWAYIDPTDLSILNNLTVVIDQTSFVNNSSVFFGGALIVTADAEIKNSYFQSNKATMYGGGMFTASDRTIIRNSLFIDNKADQDGGGVMAMNFNTSPGFWGEGCRVPIVMDNVVYALNRASVTGGALWTDCPTNVEHSAFLGNQSGIGGAILASGYKADEVGETTGVPDLGFPDGSTLSTNDTIFLSNSASIEGKHVDCLQPGPSAFPDFIREPIPGSVGNIANTLFALPYQKPVNCGL